MIGDSQVDIDAANSAGCYKSIGVRSGGNKTLNNCDYMIDDVNSLFTLFKDKDFNLNKCQHTSN